MGSVNFWQGQVLTSLSLSLRFLSRLRVLAWFLGLLDRFSSRLVLIITTLSPRYFRRIIPSLTLFSFRHNHPHTPPPPVSSPPTDRSSSHNPTPVSRTTKHLRPNRLFTLLQAQIIQAWRTTAVATATPTSASLDNPPLRHGWRNSSPLIGSQS